MVHIFSCFVNFVTCENKMDVWYDVIIILCQFCIGLDKIIFIICKK